MEMQPLVYSKKHETVGFMTQIDYKARTVSFETDDGDAGETVITTTMEDAVVMHSFGEDPDGTPLFDGDVFESQVSGSLYEAELVGGFLQFHLLDKDLKRIHKVDRYEVEKFLNMLQEADTYEVIGNKYEIEPEEEETVDFDFNIKIIKRTIDGCDDIFYYAGNRKENRQIDIIKVVYMGSDLLEEEDYFRSTFTYEEFAESMKEDRNTFVSPRELQSHVMNQMRKSRNAPLPPCGDCDCLPDEFCTVKAPADYDEEESEGSAETEAFCNECDRPANKCECELWKRKSR